MSIGAPVASKMKQSKSKPLMDPSVMGDEAPGEFIQTLTRQLALGPRQAIGMAGSVLGVGGGKALVKASALSPLGGMASQMGPNVVKRFEKEQKAQHEGVRSMTNIDQFYKNLGRATIPLYEPDEQSFLKSLFTKYQEGLRGGLPGTVK